MPFDGDARWQIDITAADRTAAAFSSVDRRIKGLEAGVASMGRTMAAGVAQTVAFGRGLQQLAVGYGVIAAGQETLITYMLFQALSMTCIGLCGSNFGAMAMEPVGHIAGTASSIQGFITSVGAVIVGSAIGQAYNGTTYPLAIGYLAIGLGVLALVYLIEDRQLFRARHAGPAASGPTPT